MLKYCQGPLCFFKSVNSRRNESVPNEGFYYPRVNYPKLKSRAELTQNKYPLFFLIFSLSSPIISRNPKTKNIFGRGDEFVQFYVGQEVWYNNTDFVISDQFIPSYRRKINKLCHEKHASGRTTNVKRWQ